VIASYDEDWPLRYERERQRISRAIGSRLLAIEHIGSTAVQGLGAKPIIDVMAGVESLADAHACIEPLRTLEYEFRPAIADRLGLHDDRFFVKSTMGAPAVHLHLTEFCGTFWRDKLLFRSVLRDNPDVAQEYEALKRDLAPRFSDGPSYSTAKTGFVLGTLEQARRAHA